MSTTKKHTVDDLQAIADRLTAEGVPTARGGKWHPVTVRNVLLSVVADVEARARAEAHRLAEAAQAVAV